MNSVSQTSKVFVRQTQWASLNHLQSDVTVPPLPHMVRHHMLVSTVWMYVLVFMQESSNYGNTDFELSLISNQVHTYTSVFEVNNIKHKPGKQLANADALSRLPLSQQLQTTTTATSGLVLQHLNTTPVTATEIKTWTDTKQGPTICND